MTTYDTFTDTIIPVSKRDYMHDVIKLEAENRKYRELFKLYEEAYSKKNSVNNSDNKKESIFAKRSESRTHNTHNTTYAEVLDSEDGKIVTKIVTKNVTKDKNNKGEDYIDNNDTTNENVLPKKSNVNNSKSIFVKKSSSHNIHKTNDIPYTPFILSDGIYNDTQDDSTQYYTCLGSSHGILDDVVKKSGNTCTDTYISSACDSSVYSDENYSYVYSRK